MVLLAVAVVCQETRLNESKCQVAVAVPAIVLLSYTNSKKTTNRTLILAYKFHDMLLIIV